MTDRGAYTSANAGMSNERGGRNSSAECPRVPGEGSSAQGKSGPKARPRGVVDGQQVDIPVLVLDRLSDGVTQEVMTTRPMVEPG